MKNNYNRVDISGTTFGYLTAIERHSKTNGGRWKWLCNCLCGKQYIVSVSDLRNGKTVSCGCRKKSGHLVRKHGMKGSPEYITWVAMRNRCNNPNNPDYKYYGGRGIAVCQKWSDFLHFYKDMGCKPSGYSIERIDVNQGYYPENCKWIPMSEQSKNRRNVKK